MKMKKTFNLADFKYVRVFISVFDQKRQPSKVGSKMARNPPKMGKNRQNAPTSEDCNFSKNLCTRAIETQLAYQDSFS